MEDRIYYAKSAKINIGGYESIGVEFGYETDVRENEKIGDAYKRAKIIVDKTVDYEAKKIKEQYEVPNDDY